MRIASEIAAIRGLKLKSLDLRPPETGAGDIAHCDIISRSSLPQGKNGIVELRAGSFVANARGDAGQRETVERDDEQTAELIWWLVNVTPRRCNPSRPGKT